MICLTIANTLFLGVNFTINSFERILSLLGVTVILFGFYKIHKVFENIVPYFLPILFCYGGYTVGVLDISLNKAE